jgi:hypothetical protein
MENTEIHSRQPGSQGGAMSQEDRRRIVDALLAEARPAIEKSGTFVPFAMAVDEDGTVRTFRSKAGSAEREVHKHLESVLQPIMKSAGSLRTFGLCMNAEAKDTPTLGPGRLLQVSLEFAGDPTAIDLLYPYRRQRSSVTWEKASEEPGEAGILGPADGEEDRPQYKKDGDELLGFLIPFAEQCLNKRDGFDPFAATVGADGKVNALAVVPPREELFVTSLREGAKSKKHRASGLCVDVTIDLPEGGRSRAIKVSIDSAAGEVVDCYVPYRKARGRIDLGELFAVPGKTAIYPKPGTPR